MKQTSFNMSLNRLNFSRPDLRGMEKETPEEFLARGGVIKREFSLHPLPIKRGVIMVQEKGSCLTCIFYHGNEGQGRCHFFPPISGKGFAEVSAETWCSRFRRAWGDPPLGAMQSNGVKKLVETGR